MGAGAGAGAGMVVVVVVVDAVVVVVDAVVVVVGACDATSAVPDCWAPSQETSLQGHPVDAPESEVAMDASPLIDIQRRTLQPEEAADDSESAESAGRGGCSKRRTYDSSASVEVLLSEFRKSTPVVKISYYEQGLWRRTRAWCVDSRHSGPSRPSRAVISVPPCAPLSAISWDLFLLQLEERPDPSPGRRGPCRGRGGRRELRRRPLRGRPIPDQALASFRSRQRGRRARGGDGSDVENVVVGDRVLALVGRVVRQPVVVAADRRSPP